MSAAEPNNMHSITELIHRFEEYRSTYRDKKGNFEAQHTSRRWDATIYRPIVDDFLIKHVPEWKKKVTWPEGKPFAACLTHDVDTARIRSRCELLRKIKLQITSERQWTKKIAYISALAGLRHKSSRIDLFSPIINEEKKYGFSSTFFVSTFEAVKAHQFDNTYYLTDKTWYRGKERPFWKVIRDLAEQGCDIGLHGSYYSATKPNLLRRQKKYLESIIGREVITSRQHNLHFNTSITPFLLEKAGLKVDTTLGFNRDIGFRCGTTYPHLLWSKSEQGCLDVLEIPLILHDCAMLRSDNLDLNQEAAFPLCCKIIDRVAAVRGVATLLWHPESIVKPGWFDLYSKLLAYIHKKGGWGTSARKIYLWWTEQRLNEKFNEAIAKLK